MDAINKAIRKVRHKFRREEVLDPVEKILAEAKGQQLLIEGWERDKKIQREHSFKKARLVRETNLQKQREEKELERLRQDEIFATRMKNLKKANRKRRKLQKEK